MATVEKPQPRIEGANNRFVLHGLSWATYERLLEELNDRPIRVTFDRGTLEFMSPSYRHEKINRWLAKLVDLLAMELDFSYECGGSTTWRREDLERGLEPDSCFYFTNAALVHGKDVLDMTVDPPPDLAIEIDASHSSVDKIAIYAALGVPELWIYENDELQVMGLTAARIYEPRAHSAFLPAAAWPVIQQFMIDPGQPTEAAWSKRFRQWVLDNLVE